MPALKTAHAPELLGLYANANRFTPPKGTVPRLSNLYLVRRGAFHTVPGSLWVSSWDGHAPHVTNQPPVVYIHWYSPSAGSSADLYMTHVGAFSLPGSPHNFVLCLVEKPSPFEVDLVNVSAAQFQPLATQIVVHPPTHPGTDPVENMTQYLDYMVVAFGLTQPPNIFPMYTTLQGAIGTADTSITVLSTIPFPPTGFLMIDAEIVHYSGLSATGFTGLTRGALGTTAAAHSAGAPVELVSSIGPTLEPWAPIINTFDATVVYTAWPGQQNVDMASASVSVPIGTVIYAIDGNNVAWLFRAQNSGFTAWGAGYYGPNFFANSLEYNDGVIALSSSNLNSAVALFTPAMVGLPITVFGADAGGADLVTTVLAFVDSANITLAASAGTAIASAGHYKITGFGSPGFVARDFNAFPGTGHGQGSGTEVWINIGQAALSAPGAAFVFQHLNFLFLWGVGINYGPDGITGPDALWQSNFNNPTSFDPSNTTFVGKGDGTTAQGGAVYSLSEAGIAATPQLVLFKDASTYSFLNAFPSAALVEVSGGLGCVAPNTIQFIGGYGVMRISYAGVTLFDGQLEHTTEYTDAIRAYLWPAVAGSQPDIIPIDFQNIRQCVSTQTKNPPTYMFFAPLVGGNGAATRGFGYDFMLRQWWIMDLPYSISAAAFLPNAIVALNQGRQALIGGSNDGTVRRILFTDDDFDGVPINWNTQLPDYGFPGTAVYVRRVNIYITQDGSGATAEITQVTFNGVRRSGRPFKQSLNMPDSLISSLDVGETVLSGNINISGSGQVLIEGTDAQSSEKPTGRVGK